MPYHSEDDQRQLQMFVTSDARSVGDNFVTFAQMQERTAKPDPISPTHYSRWSIQPIEFITANKLGFLPGNVIKYVMRYDAKNGLEDLHKARDYLDRMIADLEKGS